MPGCFLLPTLAYFSRSTENLSDTRYIRAEGLRRCCNCSWSMSGSFWVRKRIKVQKNQFEALQMYTSRWWKWLSCKRLLYYVRFQKNICPCKLFRRKSCTIWVHILVGRISSKSQGIFQQACRAEHGRLDWLSTTSGHCSLWTVKFLVSFWRSRQYRTLTLWKMSLPGVRCG